MRLLFVIGLLSFVNAVSAQRWSFEYWHQGKVVLDAGDTLKGKIKYELDKDLIQLDVNGSLQSLTSRKVVFYEIFDAVTNRYRQFYSVPYSPNGGYKSPTFFELLSEGKLTLLAREALENRSYNTGYYGYGSISRIVLVDKYFVLDDKGNINPFSEKKRNELLELMKLREDEVRKFMRSNNINLEHRPDVVRTFNYYNSLFIK
jgi:hypothetical protein